MNKKSVLICLESTSNIIIADIENKIKVLEDKVEEFFQQIEQKYERMENRRGFLK